MTDDQFDGLTRREAATLLISGAAAVPLVMAKAIPAQAAPLGLQGTSFSAKVYTADRIGDAKATGGSGSYRYALPAGVADNNLFAIDDTTGTLSLPDPILTGGVTKTVRIRVTDTVSNTSTDVNCSVAISGTVKRWNVTTLSSNPGGLSNWVAGQDNTTQVNKLRTKMLAEQSADPDVAFELTIPAGQFDHKCPEFLSGIRRVRLIGVGMDANNGTRLRNTKGGGAWQDVVHLRTNRDDYMRTDLPGDAYPFWHRGYRINTAGSGSNQITLAESVDTRHTGLAVGRRVWITSGMVYHWSYPPHTRFFETAIITGFTGRGSGAKITLDRPLRHSHRADSPESTQYVCSLGRARILFSDGDFRDYGGDQINYRGTECIIIEGIRFLRNPNWNPNVGPQNDSEQVQIFGAQYSRMEDCYMTSWGPELLERTVMRRCQWGPSEPDAQMWDTLLEDCTIDHMGGPCAPGTVTARRCTFTSSIRVGMGRFIAEDCDFTGWKNRKPDDGHIFRVDHIGPHQQIKLTNCRFWATGSGFRPIFGGTPYREYKVGQQFSYSASPTPKVTVNYVSNFNEGSPYGYLTMWLGWDMFGTGTRVMYRQNGTPRWGTVKLVTAPGGVNSATVIEIAWDSGAGGGIANGTVFRFYQLNDLIVQNSIAHGYTSQSQLIADSSRGALHDSYLLASQAVPSSVWNLTVSAT